MRGMAKKPLKPVKRLVLGGEPMDMAAVLLGGQRLNFHRLSMGRSRSARFEPGAWI